MREPKHSVIHRRKMIDAINPTQWGCVRRHVDCALHLLLLQKEEKVIFDRNFSNKTLNTIIIGHVKPLARKFHNSIIRNERIMYLNIFALPCVNLEVLALCKLCHPMSDFIWYTVCFWGAILANLWRIFKGGEKANKSPVLRGLRFSFRGRLLVQRGCYCYSSPLPPGYLSKRLFFACLK